MPSDWENASIENIITGDNSISIFYQRKEANTLQYHIKQSKDDWKLVLVFPSGKYKQWQLNGKTVSPITSANLQFFEISGPNSQIVLK